MNYELLGQAFAQFLKDVNTIAESILTQGSISGVSYSSEAVSDEAAKQMTEIKVRKEPTEISEFVLDLSREAIEGYIRSGERGVLIKVANALAKEGFGEEITTKIATATIIKRLRNFLDNKERVLVPVVDRVVDTAEAVVESAAAVVDQIEASFESLLGLGSDKKEEEVVTPVIKPRRAPIAKLAAFTDKIADLTKSLIDRGKDRDAVVAFVNNAIEKNSYDGSVRGVAEESYEEILKSIESEFASVEDFGSLLERLYKVAEEEGYAREEIESYAHTMAAKTGANLETFEKICKGLGLVV